MARAKKILEGLYYPRLLKLLKSMYIQPPIIMSISEDLPVPLPSDATIATPRLLLRPLAASDLRAYHAMRGDPRVMKFSKTHLPDASPDETWTKLRPLIPLAHGGGGEGYVFGIELLEEAPGARQIVGDLGALEFERVGGSGDGGAVWEGEIGYMFAPRLWGNGYATEALRAYVEHWEELLGRLAGERDLAGESKVEVVLKAITEEENVGSFRVLVKCGFVERRRFVEERSDDRLVEMVLLRKGEGGRS